MCMKGRAAPEIVYHPQRLRYPMRRTTPKGSATPGWRRISWDEALSVIAQRLDEIRNTSGPEAVVFGVTTPSGTPISDSIDWIERFVRMYGSPNICYATEICNWHKDVAHAFTFGCGIPPADYSNAETILLWGHNPANTWLAQANAIANGLAKGAKMIVVDPRPTAMARQADVWLPVRPGTDAALALGLIRQILKSNVADLEFVSRWTNAPYLVRSDNGEFLREQDLWPDAESNHYVVWDTCTHRPLAYDPDKTDGGLVNAHLQMQGDILLEIERNTTKGPRELCCKPAFEHLLATVEPYHPEHVAELTGVSVENQKAAIPLFTSGRRIAYHAWTGIGQHTNATQTERAVALLYALTGAFDRVGANRVRRGPFFQPVNALDLMEKNQRDKALGLAERPLGPPAQGWVTALDTYRAILNKDPYPVRAMVAFGTNLLVSQADTGLAEQALKNLEFHVQCDLFETPSARYADILLPINSPWEREGLRMGFEISDDAASLVQLRQRMVSPIGESRSDYEIVFDLACRLGMGHDFFGGSVEQGWNHMLAPMGLDVETLRRNPQGIHTRIDSREQKYALPHHDSEGSTGKSANDECHGKVRGFDTETRRVEIYSARLNRHGQDPVPVFIPPAEFRYQKHQEEPTKKNHFPLILSSAKNGYYCHSQHRNLVSLRKRAPDPIAEIGPGLAAEKGLRNGDWALISTRRGSARFITRITQELANDVVIAEFGWWQSCTELDRPEMPAEGKLTSNFNNLISAQAHDPISGSIAHRSFRCNITADPQTEERQRAWEGYRKYRISNMTIEADGVAGITFETMEEELLPDYRPGQHVEVRLMIEDVPYHRAYSLTGAASVAGRTQYSIAVRHQEGMDSEGSRFEGLVSSHIHRHWHVGLEVELKAPAGTFVLPRVTPEPLILLAGGIGITPFLSLLQSLPDGNETEILLLYANRNSSTHAFREQLSYHAQRLKNLRIVNHYSAPLDSDMKGKDYESDQRIDASQVPQALLAARARVYMCGPQAMMEAFAKGLVARGVPAFDIFREVFRSPPPPMADDGRMFEVSFTGSYHATGTWSTKQGPLLAFGEKLGLPLPSGCRVGQCESCAVRIRSGSVRHLHGEEPDDPAVCLTCQAVPLENLVLET